MHIGNKYFETMMELSVAGSNAVFFYELLYFRPETHTFILNQKPIHLILIITNYIDYKFKDLNRILRSL